MALFKCSLKYGETRFQSSGNTDFKPHDFRLDAVMWSEHYKKCCQRKHELCPYGLRRSIRCPKKYGEIIKERKNMLAPSYDLDIVCEKCKADPQKKPLEDRYIRNAAVLPHLKEPYSDAALTTEEKTCNSVPTVQPGPVMIHGFTVPEYQQTYHSVVDPLLYSPCGKLRAYSLELGRHIKEHLFQELCYPMLLISDQPKGEVEVVEKFCVLRPIPFIDIDSTGEPQ